MECDQNQIYSSINARVVFCPKLDKSFEGIGLVLCFGVLVLCY